MSTTIEWTDETWNPTTGCTKVSQGCKHCYAERVFPRAYGKARKFIDVMTHPDRLEAPLHWKKPRRVFVNSMSDLFHEAVPSDFIAAVFQKMAMAPQHTFQILTKRPERMLNFATGGKAFAEPLPNVHLGVSCEDQPTADERIPLLLQTPAAVRFVSLEPLLGQIDMRRWLSESLDTAQAPTRENGKNKTDLPSSEAYRGAHQIDWVIAGGESGPHARPSHPDWFRSLRDQCVPAATPFFFKQWGEWEPIGKINNDKKTLAELQRINSAVESRCEMVSITGEILPDVKPSDKTAWMMERIGKRYAGAKLDGREWREFPA